MLSDPTIRLALAAGAVVLLVVVVLVSRRKGAGGRGDRQLEQLIRDGRLGEAARRAVESGDLAQGVELYMRAQQPANAASLAARLGDERQAAELYERAGNLERAAHFYGRVGMEAKAVELRAVVFECERNPLAACLPGFGRIARTLAGTATATGGGLDDLSRLMRSTTLAAASLNGNGDAARRAQAAVDDFRQTASASGAEDIAGYEAPLLSDAAWFQLLNGEFELALASSREAAALAPDAVLYQSNLAHALMFTGEVDAARAIYLAHLDAETIGGMNWQAYITSDFDALRAAGYDHALMAEIVAVFR